MKRILLLFFLLLLAAVASLDPPRSEAKTTDVELRVLGYTQWTAGGPASFRVIAYDPHDVHGVAGVPVEATLLLPQSKTPLVVLRGTTNEQGTLDAQFTVPDLEGAATLKVSSTTCGDLQSSVQIHREEKIYLTTDKPLYQPGQQIHLRALALHQPTLVPVAEAPLSFEVEDSRGNKVYKFHTATSKFGVAAATFDLASEVNMGEYHVRCLLGSDGKFTAEKSVTVKKYALPKFKVSVKTDKTFYLPKEVVKGTVQADYFFGKPVAGAQITIDASTFDVGERHVATLQGVTNVNGTYSFEMPLPDYFVGQPLDKGKAELAFRVGVKDAAEHQEEQGAQVAVVASPITAEVFAESGNLLPNLPNKIYILTLYPDGTPAPCDLRLTLPGLSTSLATDATGFGEITYTPKAEAAQSVNYPNQQRYWRGRPVAAVRMPYGGGSTWNVPTAPLVGQIVVKDARGSQATLALSLPLAQLKDTVLLRPDKALYRVGDIFHAHLLSSKKNGNAYVDFIRDNQTILTRSVDIRDGRGDISFALTPDTYGALQVHAYEIMSTSDIIRDTRQIFVQPAKDLLVSVKMDKGTYRPGEESKLTFMVKDAQGAPTLAVLGVDIVDESLFALAERQPGLERVYFLLEKEMMAARYEVHGHSLSDMIKDQRTTSDPQSQRYSQVLFSKMPQPQVYNLRLDTFSAKLQQLYQRMARVQSAVYNYHARHGSFWPKDLQALVEEGVISATDVRDVWGRQFRVKYTNNYPVVYSVGPDGLAGTADDIDMQTAQNELYDDELAQTEAFGGHGGGVARRGVLAGNVMQVPMAAPMGAATKTAALDAGANDRDYKKSEDGPVGRKDGQPATRVRELFPETLFTAPQVITDANGTATLQVPLADSITTWRLMAFASSVNGKMGNASSGIRVFQDFFVDLDVPVSLTQGDVVSVPVAIYNYLPEGQTVELTLEPADWYEQVDGGSRQVKLSKNEVSGASFQIRAKKPGAFPLTLHARGSKMSDAVRRGVQVMPDGREFTQVQSDRLTGTMQRVVDIPTDAVADASKMFVTIYPGIFSQVVEGLDNILRMPGGCFEQTSSTTYPNVLVTNYLKKMRKTTPEIQMKAEGYINAGYQRLLTFEVPGGGFSVFGQAPANPILTAYGLMEFADMSKVHEVDANLLARTKTWLLAQQRQDGSWSAGRQGFYAEGWSHVPNSDLVATAYITWALLETGDRSKGLGTAVAYIKSHAKQVDDPYTAALAANALVAWDPKDAAAAAAIDTLLAMKIDDKDVTYWRTTIATAAYGTGTAGDIETTALAALALINSGDHAAMANKAISYLVKSKDAFGTWQSTQATILAMKVFVASIDKAGEKVDANVSVLVNGKKAGSFHMNADNFDVFHQIDVSSLVSAGANQVVLSVEGQGNALFKIATQYYRPWKDSPPPPGGDMSIDVSYDRTTLAKNDTAVCTVHVTNHTQRIANQIIVDVGVPPGFDVKSDDLEALVKKQVIQKFSLTGRQVILYLDKIDPASTFSLSYAVKARFPVRAQAPASHAYEYYNPDRQALTAPQLMQIQ